MHLRKSVVVNDAHSDTALDRCVSGSALPFVARAHFGRYPDVYGARPVGESFAMQAQCKNRRGAPERRRRVFVTTTSWDAAV